MSWHSFDAAFWIDEKRQLKAHFSNSPAGFRRFVAWLKRHGFGKLRVGVESTNICAEALLNWLYEKGYPVFLLNAEQVSHYARTLGRRNKTDPADALVIARFVALHEQTPWLPPPPEHKTLRSLLRTRHQLMDTRLQIANQLRTADATARPYLQAIQRSILAQLKVMAQDLAAHLRAHPVLNANVRRLMTFKGVGVITAATVIAELPPITAQTDPRTICAWAGLIPCRRQSGKTELPSRISKRGNRYLRHALYMPALTAKRFNPQIKTFAARLAERGKTKSAVLGAVAHKMLRILVGMLKHQSDYDPNWVFSK